MAINFSVFRSIFEIMPKVMSWITVQLIEKSGAASSQFKEWRENCVKVGVITPGHASVLHSEVLTPLPDIRFKASLLSAMLLFWVIQLACLLVNVVLVNPQKEGSIRGAVWLWVALLPATFLNTLVLAVLQGESKSANAWGAMLYRRRYIVFTLFHVLSALALTVPLLTLARPETDASYLLPAGVVGGVVVIEFSWSTLLLLFSPLFDHAFTMLVFPIGLPFWSTLLVAIVLWVVRVIWWVLARWKWLASAFYQYSDGRVTVETSSNDVLRHIFIPIAFLGVGSAVVLTVLKKMWEYK